MSDRFEVVVLIGSLAGLPAAAAAAVVVVAIVIAEFVVAVVVGVIARTIAAVSGESPRDRGWAPRSSGTQPKN